MKRRDSLAAAAAAAAAALASIPIVVHSADRRFGVPGSVDQTTDRTRRLHLKLSRAEMPVGVWEEIERLDSLWADVAASAEVRAKFRTSPKSLLGAYGLDISILSGQDRESRVMAAVCDPIVQESITQRDYVAFLQHLQRRGVITGGLENSGLVTKLAELFASDRKKYRALVSGAIGGEDIRSPMTGLVFVVFDVAVAVYVLAVVAVVVMGMTADDNPMLRATATLTPERLELLADANRVARLIGSPEAGSAVMRGAVRSEIAAIIQAAVIAGVADLRGLTQDEAVDRITQRVAMISL